VDDALSTSQTLRIIDGYLTDVNENSAMQEILNIVKPYFVNQIMSKLNDTGNELARLISVPETAGNVLEYYYLNKMFPGHEKSETLQKFIGYSHKETQQEQAFTAIPQLAPGHKIRTMLYNWESFEDIRDWQSKSTAERMEESVKSTKSRLEQMQKFEDNLQKMR